MGEHRDKPAEPATAAEELAEEVKQAGPHTAKRDPARGEDDGEAGDATSPNVGAQESAHRDDES
ncbi:hypothetical protein [Streptomyces sp. ISL-100]|uniref:hypothetical protein n=1 Tax=Streptomyces sp. ISL-100 TaxID=2819173 RepID=UPI001BECAE20|nr:hypothetical protein [Streptomyces sp. ISL-100]MBT2397738.1 hypothetical protein [Streptomyces sp. ISL-100]